MHPVHSFNRTAFRKLDDMAATSSYAQTLGPDTGLPSNVAAEKMILGAILLENQALSEAEEKLTPEDFSLDSHQRIYLRMTELGGNGHAIDLVTLANELAKYKEVESVGGVAYLSSLTEGLPRRPVIEEYIRIVKDKSLLRQLMLICSAAIARAADQSETALDVLNAAESQLMVVGEKASPKASPASKRSSPAPSAASTISTARPAKSPASPPTSPSSTR
jgi:replicative DNA helicase